MAFPKFSFFGSDDGFLDSFWAVIGARAMASGDNAHASVKVSGVVSGDDVSGSVVAKASAEDSDNAASATADTSFVSSDPDIVVVQVEESNQAEDGSHADATSELTFESADDDLAADDAFLGEPALVFGQDDQGDQGDQDDQGQDTWMESPTDLNEVILPHADLVLISIEFA